MKRAFLAVVVCLSIAAYAARSGYQIGSLFTSISAATVATVGTEAAIPMADGHERPGKITWHYTFAGGAQPTSHTTNLEGSIDGVNFYVLDTSGCVICAFAGGQQGELRHIVNKTVPFLRCNITALTLGGATSETCQLIVEKP